MTDSLQQQLRDDARRISQVAQKRLEQGELMSQLTQAINHLEAPSKPSKIGAYRTAALAAALALSVALGLMHPTSNPGGMETPSAAASDSNTTTEAVESWLVKEALPQMWDYPGQVENQVQAALTAEQQAIINDLKKLKNQIINPRSSAG